MKVSEHAIQVAFVEWCNWHHAKYPGIEFAFAVPNGSARHPAVAAKLKAEGVRKGVIDWLCPARRNGFSGLGIEFKAGKNKPTLEQKDFIAHLRDEGWYVEIAYSTEEAIDVVTRYFRQQTEVT